MFRHVLRGVVVALVAGVGLLAAPSAAQAADGCDAGYKKYRDGFFTKDDYKRLDSSHNFWIYHTGQVRACTKVDEGWGLDDERRRVIIGGPWVDLPMRTEVRPSGTFVNAVCVNMVIKARLSGVRSSSGVELTIGGDPKVPLAVTYSSQSKDMTATVFKGQVCGSGRTLVLEASGIRLTAADEGARVEWVEMTTSITATYINSAGAKVKTSQNLAELDYTSAGDEPDPRVVTNPPPPTEPPPPPPPPPASPCQDNNYWRAQFGVSGWDYQPNSDQNQTNQKRYVFDRMFYYFTYPDVQQWAQGKVATQGGNLWDHVQWHWLNYGIGQGRIGSPTFHAGYYLSTNPDLLNAFGWNYQAAIDHYVVYGRNEGRRGSFMFDPGFYRGCYGDLAGMSNAELLEHFTINGIEEGRQGSADFAPAWYLAAYPDVRANYGNNNYRGGMVHWYSNGSGEGRQGHP